jgi:histone H3/H4
MGKRKSEYLSWQPIRNLMKENGAKVVSLEAVNELISWNEKILVEITKTALEITKNAKRKKISVNDILLAIKYTAN